jgi:Protein of unknown function (DUF3179)
MMPKARALTWAALGASLVVSLFCVAYPMYVIRPFRAQGPRELAAALLATRIRPALTLVCMAVAIAAALYLWRRARVATTIGVALVLVCAWLARVNVYEKMFHPLEHPQFAAASATKLDSAEKVIAVNIGGAARAYPIRGISYHHVVNDWVGGVPIVATY